LSPSDFIMEFQKIQNNLEESLKLEMQDPGEMISKFHNLWQELENKNRSKFTQISL